MWMWLHHILEPHCPECKEEREENKVCQSCEVLKHQLEVANYTQRELIRTLAEINKPEPSVQPPEISPEQLRPKMLNWRVKQQMLQEEDRAKARVIAENKKRQEEAKSNSIEQLESELGVK